MSSRMINWETFYSITYLPTLPACLYLSLLTANKWTARLTRHWNGSSPESGDIRKEEGRGHKCLILVLGVAYSLDRKFRGDHSTSLLRYRRVGVDAAQ